MCSWPLTPLPLEVQVCPGSHGGSGQGPLGSASLTPCQCQPTGELQILWRNHLEDNQELSGENPQVLIPEGIFGALVLTGGGASVSLLPLLLLSEVLGYSKAIKGDGV